MPPETPVKPPREPLRPPSLRWLDVGPGDERWRPILRFVSSLTRLTILGAYWFGRGIQWLLLTVLGGLLCFAWREFRKGDFFTWIFRIMTMAGFAWLLYDRYYETSATISVSASDPQDPFSFPFVITNNSHFIPITNVAWTCNVEHLEAGGNAIDTSQFHLKGNVSPILPGQSVNFECAIIGRHSRFIHMPTTPKVTAARMTIEFTYTVRILGVNKDRHPQPTRFTWYSDASNPQWIRGEFAK